MIRFGAVFGRIRPLWFFAAFAVGLLVCYLVTPPPEVVVRFPSPFNADQIVYRDKSDGCFKIGAEQVPCPRDKAAVRPQPIMEDMTARQPAAPPKTNLPEGQGGGAAWPS